VNDDAGFETRFLRWLSEDAGIVEPRRLVRVDAATILVSKFEAGFAARLHQSLAQLPNLTDEDAVRRAYRIACEARPDSTRVAAWQAAMGALLAAETGPVLSADEQSEVRAGIDSVAALLDSILWSGPTAAAEYAVLAGETDAYAEAVSRMDEGGMFTRFYGVFEGRRVENHCPGAQFARILLAQAWTLCTGSTPPKIAAR